MQEAEKKSPVIYKKTYINAHLVFIWMPARAASALQTVERKPTIWLLDEKNFNNFWHVEGEGVGTLLESFSAPKAHVH